MEVLRFLSSADGFWASALGGHHCVTGRGGAFSGADFESFLLCGSSPLAQILVSNPLVSNSVVL